MKNSPRTLELCVALMTALLATGCAGCECGVACPDGQLVIELPAGMQPGLWSFEITTEKDRRITCETTLPAIDSSAAACSDPEVELRLHPDAPEEASPGELAFTFWPERVQVVPTACGGGFGGKLDLGVQPLVAVAAWLLDRPVRCVFTRPESMRATTKRHPARMTATMAADAEGRLTAVDFHGDFDTGAYASWGPTVANRVPVHASGPYVVPAVRATTRAIHTTGPIAASSAMSPAATARAIPSAATSLLPRSPAISTARSVKPTARTIAPPPSAPKRFPATVTKLTRATPPKACQPKRRQR